MLSISGVQENYHLKWYRSNKYAHQYDVMKNNKVFSLVSMKGKNKLFVELKKRSEFVTLQIIW